MIFLQSIAVIVVLLLLITAAQQHGSGQIDVNGFLLYEDPISGVRLQYPSNWTKVNYTGPENQVTFVPTQKAQEQSLSQLTILIKNVSNQNKSLSTYVEEQINYLDHYLLDFDLIESVATTLAGYSAYKTVYTFKLPYLPGEYKSMEMWMTNATKIYIVNYKADEGIYNDYISLIENIIYSLQIIW